MIRSNDLHKALNRLEKEIDKPGGFNEYAQFCEELLLELLPHLTAKGKAMALEAIRSNYCLESDENEHRL
ncbi:hypothetical protein EBB07_28505 [Paenibacillaceae bacterium]|nr:hypothetical protein EBB07_28505 [Paenibacillaceae bacterium]